MITKEAKNWQKQFISADLSRQLKFLVVSSIIAYKVMLIMVLKSSFLDWNNCKTPVIINTGSEDRFSQKRRYKDFSEMTIAFHRVETCLWYKRVYTPHRVKYKQSDNIKNQRRVEYNRKRFNTCSYNHHNSIWWHFYELRVLFAERQLVLIVKIEHHSF